MLSVKQRLKAIRGLDLTSESSGSKLKLEVLKENGYLDIEAETFKVVNVSRYLDVKWKNFSKRNSDYWVTELELVNLISGETLFVEWEIDDEMEISKTLGEVKMRDIQFQGSPLTRSNLESIADAETGEVKCQNKVYHYVEDDTWAALYYRAEGANPLPVRMYEFESDDGSYLTVESWEDGDDRPSREAFISASVKAQSLNILQN